MLSLVVFLPLAGALALLLVPNRDGSKNGLIRWAALGVSLLSFASTLALWAQFDPAAPGFQMVERLSWVPSFGIEYLLGLDGISLMLVVLTGFLTPLALLCSLESVVEKL
jgi:NADH-quinone oxidoreductase subunit M